MAGTRHPLAMRTAKPSKLPSHIGPYRVLGQLGEGATSIVFRARDEFRARDVAIKCVSAPAAAIAGDPDEAQAAARTAVSRSGLPDRCQGDPSAEFAWEPSDLGTWQGSVITVTVSCTVSNQTLTGVWTPGNRTVTVSDSQVVERFRR